MMKCSKCGCELNDNAKFCRSCGAMIDGQTESISDKITCRKCGNELDRTALFCNVCGTKVSMGNDLDVKNNLKPTSSLKPWIIALISVLVVCGIVIAFIFVKNSNSNYDDLVLSNESMSSDTESDDISDQVEEKSTDEIDLENEKEYGHPLFSFVQASSELDDEQELSYRAANVDDGKDSTAWVEGKADEGIGEYLTYSSEDKQKVSGIKIKNGYCKSNDLYNKNNRVNEVEITFSDGNSIIEKLQDIYNEYTDIQLEQPVITDEIQIKILSVYKGTKYNDTCISEIIIY